MFIPNISGNSEFIFCEYLYYRGHINAPCYSFTFLFATGAGTNGAEAAGAMATRAMAIGAETTGAVATGAGANGAGVPCSPCRIIDWKIWHKRIC